MKTIKAPTVEEIQLQIENEIKHLDTIIRDETRSDYIRERSHRLKLMFMALDAKVERELRINWAKAWQTGNKII